jgi:uncharacterized membrane protein
LLPRRRRYAHAGVLNVSFTKSVINAKSPYQISKRCGELAGMRGAVVFVVAFAIFLVITLGYIDLPPAKAIYDGVVGAETDYDVLGIPATLLVVAVFNGAIYGFIIWLIYALAEKAGLTTRAKS